MRALARVPAGVRLALVLAAAAAAAAGAARLLEGVGEPGPGPKLEAAAAAVAAHYAAHPPRQEGWRVAGVAAWPAAVEVRLRLPGAQVAGLLQSPYGFQLATLAEACPPDGAAVWTRLEADEDIRLVALDRHGERFLTVRCRVFRGALENPPADRPNMG